jgi:hypothetical protein
MSFLWCNVLAPLLDPISQLGVFVRIEEHSAVPVDFAIVGKLAQTVFPGGDNTPIKPKLPIPGYGRAS